MVIHVPIGVKHVATVQGEFLRMLTCAHCHEPYAVVLKLEARGENHDVLFVGGEASADLARQKAQQNLLSKSQNVVHPVPCPTCGCYQDDMVRILKEERSINILQIVGGVISCLSLVPLAFSLGTVSVSLTVVMALLGLSLLARGLLQALRFDPNAGDPESRKALGRDQAVWGERLIELLASDRARE
ncbi:MAG TPA: hypothetical protein VH370_22905 [Humisphaera sp.]|jgi:hypothetical protein|nr:hypothetical protein [Humisphaera sp.]